MCHVANSAKLEKWLDPSIESSVEPSALKSASRNPKLFFGVSFIFSSKWQEIMIEMLFVS